ncbi:hypothetical protein AEA09_11225 [Lysinibacillus contaminans]|uniref:Uncharacterized protein n=1 Tax=Lysinibacillus contaminans TaxID=1293441 RepID=A0ABR5K314_9BACI|nr:hypothetical protein [Lysinibacillus contaminans]KOS69060.1 hypothetical protein AEA09_11225 [Lysinibacillus contaminans]
MIISAEITEQPIAGQFDEIIYEVSSPTTIDWTWVKFEDENYYEWYGQFRGLPKSIALSTKHNKVLILTSDYLIEIDCISKKMTSFESIYEEQKIYQDLTVTPDGDFIIADYYSIELVGALLDERQTIESPKPMDMIKFNGWIDNHLQISCLEFPTNIKIKLELDTNSMKIHEK